MEPPSPAEWRHPLEWLELDAPQARDHPGLLAAIRRREVDGFTMSGVFSADECQQAVDVLARRRDEFPNAAIFGTMLGLPLAEIARLPSDGGGLERYFDVAERSRAFHVEAFGLDPLDRIREVLAPMADGMSIETPSRHGRKYATANVRWMEPGGGGLPAHVGNEFLMHEDESTDHLRSTTTTIDHYSWFMVLQPPSAGGALSLFDLLFDSDATELGAWGEAGRDDSYLEQIGCHKIYPAAGSLIVFCGGRRWHRVDPIEGDRARVTYGGFAGVGVDGDSIQFWF